MYTANDVRNVRFGKSVNGYNRDDVDAFLDNVEEDYKQYEAKVRELDARVLGLSKEIEDLRISQHSIQSVLVSAQKLADQIVDEAKGKAEQIIVESKMRANDIDKAVDEKAAEDMKVAEAKQKEAEADYVRTMQRTAEKSEAMISAAHDSVARQQLLFDKLKLDIVNFKSQVMAIYKEHIDSLSKLPDEVPFDAVRAAEAAVFNFESIPDYSAQKVETVEETAETETVEETVETVEEVAEEIEETTQETETAEESEPITERDVPLGFQVNFEDTDEDESEDDEEDIDYDQPKKGFFKRNR